MKNHNKIFAFPIFLCMFVMPNTYDCSLQTEEKQSRYNHIRVRIKKNDFAHAETVVSPFNSSRYFGFVCVWHSMGFNFYNNKSLNLEVMPNTQEKERFEGRGELSPHQTAAALALLSVIDKETIQQLDDIFLGYLYSDFCDSQSGAERSTTGYIYFAVRSFLVTLLTPSPSGGAMQLRVGVGLHHSAQEGAEQA
jgi:hypothetical protein